MTRVLRHRPSPAMAVALLALFVSLGGGAYAALKLPKNSVGPRQLKRGAVTGPKIRNGAVISAKVKDASLLAKDFKAGQLPRGAQGLPGPQGPKGDTGSPGAPGTALGYARVNADGTVIDAASKGVSSANVTKVGAAGYCFHGLGFTVGSAAATAEFNNTPSDTSAQVELPASSASFLDDTACAAGTQAFVFTQDGGAASAQPFYVIFT